MNYKTTSSGMIEEIIEIGRKHDVSAKVIEHLSAVHAELVNFKVAVPLMGALMRGKPRSSIIFYRMKNYRPTLPLKQQLRQKLNSANLKRLLRTGKQGQ